MKLLVFFVILIALAKADDEERRAKIKNMLSKLPKYQKPLASSRIIGGTPTAPHSRPYQVFMNLLIWGDIYHCSGTLISTKFVLTAAHCIFVADNGTIILGAYDLTVQESSQVTRSVTFENFRVHENWDLDIVANDIATIEFDEPVELNEYIQTITLPTFADARRRFIGRGATIVGWGITSDDATEISPVLRQVNTTVITNIHCHIMFKILDAWAVLDTHICTSGYGGVGVCDDDSGGPLVIGDKQIGIVSWAYIGNCAGGWPSVFTRVTSFLKWIQDNSNVKIAKC